ncbi:hypothetical protein PCC79_16070 [Propioniciclava soli]|uniref:Uncharacterized protein n=1 Tax=Propioniciclava soli TaxID=2775081 RepID=A0ABZ3C7C7_9ACTN
MPRSRVNRSRSAVFTVVGPCRVQGLRVPSWLAWVTRLSLLTLAAIPVHQLFYAILGPHYVTPFGVMGISEATFAAWCVAMVILPGYLWITFAGWLQQRSQWRAFLTQARTLGADVIRVECVEDVSGTASTVNARSVTAQGDTADAHRVVVWDSARDVRPDTWVALSESRRVLATATSAERDADLS